MYFISALYLFTHMYGPLDGIMVLIDTSDMIQASETNAVEVMNKLCTLYLPVLNFETVCK